MTSITLILGKFRLEFDSQKQAWVDQSDSDIQFDLLPGEDQVEALERIREEFYNG